MGKYRVELHFWKSQQGYSHSETIDNFDEKMSAEEYFKNLDDDLTPDDPNEAINIEIYDNDTDKLVSEYWAQKNN